MVVSESKKKTERKEALMRIVVLIITGIVLWLWGYVSYVLMFINWIYTLIAGMRYKPIADFVEYWTSTVYYFSRYLSGVSNTRPFPFNELKAMSKFEK